MTTHLMKGGSNSGFLNRSFLDLTVKKLRKLIHFCQSYRKNKSGRLF